MKQQVDLYAYELIFLFLHANNLSAHDVIEYDTDNNWIILTKEASEKIDMGKDLLFVDYCEDEYFDRCVKDEKESIKILNEIKYESFTFIFYVEL